MSIERKPREKMASLVKFLMRSRVKIVVKMWSWK
jgi:hypothetical protein